MTAVMTRPGDGLAGWPAWTCPCLRMAAGSGPSWRIWPTWSSRTARGSVSRAGAVSSRPGRPPRPWRPGWRRPLAASGTPCRHSTRLSGWRWTGWPSCAASRRPTRGCSPVAARQRTWSRWERHGSGRSSGAATMSPPTACPRPCGPGSTHPGRRITLSSGPPRCSGWAAPGPGALRVTSGSGSMWRRCGPRSPRMSVTEWSRWRWWAPQARPTPGRLTRWATWRRSPASTAPGSTSTAPTG